MQLLENIRLALAGLGSNKMRAFLTMLGIIIGISSVLTIVTVGNAMTSSVSGVLNDMGANNIQIQLSDKPDEHGNTNYTRAWTESDMVTDEMLAQYQEAFGDKIQITAVSKSVGQGQAINGHNQAKGSITGTNAGANEIQNIGIVAGHFLNEREVNGEKYVVVLSDRFVKELYGNIPLQEALGREVTLRMAQGTFAFRVVGVYHYEVSGVAASMTGDTTSMLFIPVTVAERIGDMDSGYPYLMVRASSSVTDTQKFAEQTAEWFNRRFYRSNPYVQVEAYSMDSMVSQMNTVMSTLSMAIGIIAGISLLVGGIGVMNIMLVSVTERTREIGTRKALGAKNGAIRAQFIVESMIICAIGGLIGVLLGGGLGYAVSGLLGDSSLPSASAVLTAVGFSMLIGVFFGYYPAGKAAKLNPIEALRYE